MAVTYTTFTFTDSAHLDELPIVNGQLTVLTDKDEMYYDIENKRRPVDGPHVKKIEQAIKSINTTLGTKEDKSNKVDAIQPDPLPDEYPNVQAVIDFIDAMPEPMIFKGSVGPGGTIETLPGAESTNEGHTYKVIQDGTYAGQAAKKGDTFISNGEAWILIPSGDEPVVYVGTDAPSSSLGKNGDIYIQKI